MLLCALLCGVSWCLLARAAVFQAPPRALISPDWPPPRHLRRSGAIQAAITQFEQAVKAGFNGSTPNNLPTDSQTTSWSVELFSAHAKRGVYTYHYDAPGLANASTGVQKVDSNTIYRVGSISKTLSVYLYLINEGFSSWNDPVSKYTPEFAAYQKQYQAEIDAQLPGFWDFDSITVGSIASQLAGFPREAAGSSDLDMAWLGLGMPYIEPFPANYTDAGCPNVGNNYGQPCTRAALLGNLLAQSPGQPAYYAPGYSNLGYAIFAVVVEDITGRNFTSIFQEDLVQKLGLNATYYRDAPVAQGIIPFNETIAQYTVDINVVAPSGNFYSTINDFRKIGRSMLLSTQVKPAITRQWLKPMAFVSNPKQAVGGSWEIYEAPLASKQSWMYTKSGAIGAYQSYLILLPDWDAGITIMCAGAFTGYPVQEFLANTMTKVFVPALEQAAREEANSTYAGTYRDVQSNSTVVIGSGGDGPGLEVLQWVTNGTDILAVIGQFYYRGDAFQARLYPSGLVARSRGLIQLTFVPYRNNATYDDEPFSLYGAEWFGLYGTPYRGASPAQWLFELDECKTKAISVRPAVLNVTLTRQS